MPYQGNSSYSRPNGSSRAYSPSSSQSYYPSSSSYQTYSSRTSIPEESYDASSSSRRSSTPWYTVSSSRRSSLCETPTNDGRGPSPPPSRESRSSHREPNEFTGGGCNLRRRQAVRARESPYRPTGQTLGTADHSDADEGLPGFSPDNEGGGFKRSYSQHSNFSYGSARDDDCPVLQGTVGRLPAYHPANPALRPSTSHAADRGYAGIRKVFPAKEAGSMTRHQADPAFMRESRR